VLGQKDDIQSVYTEENFKHSLAKVQPTLTHSEVSLTKRDLAYINSHSHVNCFSKAQSPIVTGADNINTKRLWEVLLLNAAIKPRAGRNAFVTVVNSEHYIS
jgi:predicted 3-demethylubiquinone-9 3-methyltransferase (glyoxalase superfamily)